MVYFDGCKVIEGRFPPGLYRENEIITGGDCNGIIRLHSNIFDSNCTFETHKRDKKITAHL